MIESQRIEFDDSSYISAIVIKKPVESQEIINNLIGKLNWLNVLQYVVIRKDQVKKDIQLVTNKIKDLERYEN